MDVQFSLSPTILDLSSLRIGDRVIVRDAVKTRWQRGIVEELSFEHGPNIHVDGNRTAFRYEFVRLPKPPELGGAKRVSAWGDTDSEQGLSDDDDDGASVATWVLAHEPRKDDSVPDSMVGDVEAVAAFERVTLTVEARLFRDLFADWSDDAGRQASAEDRRAIKEDRTLTYGEVLYPTFVSGVLERVRALGGLDPETSKVFTDVGCGTAKPVFAAALGHPFKLCRGIEVLGTVANLAKDIAHAYVSRIQPQLPRGDGRRATVVEVVHANAFAEGCDWSDSDLVFVNSTCFTAELFVLFAAKCELLKPGAFVVTTTLSLVSPSFKLLVVKDLWEDWGNTSVHFHVKRHAGDDAPGFNEEKPQNAEGGGSSVSVNLEEEAAAAE